MMPIAAHTSKGPVRRTNQDACCVEVAQTKFGDAVMAVVCDGVGGLASGEVASAFVVGAFDHWFGVAFPELLSAMSQGYEDASIEDSWRILLGSLNERLQAQGLANGERLGTTFTGVLACSGKYMVGHVGDCRLYRVVGDQATRITEDQTLVAYEVARGLLSDEQARVDSRRNVILQAVGATPVLRPAFYRGTCDACDLFVVCSDGAYRTAGDEGIRSAFSQAGYAVVGLDMACHALIERSIMRGETDNLTVACFSPGTRRPRSRMRSRGSMATSEVPRD